MPRLLLNSGTIKPFCSLRSPDRRQITGDRKPLQPGDMLKEHGSRFTHAETGRIRRGDSTQLPDAKPENWCQNYDNWLAEDLAMAREILRFAANGAIEVDTASRTLRATTKKMLTYFGLNGRKAKPKEVATRKRARRDLENFVTQRFGDGKPGWTWLTPEGKKVKTLSAAVRHR